MTFCRVYSNLNFLASLEPVDLVFWEENLSQSKRKEYEPSFYTFWLAASIRNYVLYDIPQSLNSSSCRFLWSKTFRFYLSLLWSFWKFLSYFTKILWPLQFLRYWRHDLCVCLLDLPSDGPGLCELSGLVDSFVFLLFFFG